MLDPNDYGTLAEFPGCYRPENPKRKANGDIATSHHTLVALRPEPLFSAYNHLHPTDQRNENHVAAGDSAKPSEAVH